MAVHDAESDEPVADGGAGQVAVKLLAAHPPLPHL